MDMSPPVKSTDRPARTRPGVEQMRSLVFASATMLLAMSGLAAPVQAANYAPAAAAVLQGQNGGTATGGPAGGLPDRN